MVSKRAANIPPPPGLTMPEELWCPECGVHARHQDQYSFAQSEHILMPMCPVCADIRRREKLGLEP